ATATPGRPSTWTPPTPGSTDRGPARPLPGPARSRPPPGWLPTIGAELPTTGMEQLSTDERSAPPPHAPGVHPRRRQLPLHGHPRWARAMARPRSVRPSRGTHRLARIVGEVAAQTCALVVTRQCRCGSEGTWLCPGCAAQLAAAPLRVGSCCEALQHLSAARVLPQGPLLPAGVDHTPLLPVLALGDRKSTRLNSSHVSISYAVFCLK